MLLVVAASGLWLLAATLSADAQGTLTPEVWTTGEVTFEEIRAGPRTLQPRLDRAYWTTGRFSLPDGAAQGHGSWYAVEWHLRLRRAARSGDGLAYVKLSTNGATCCQIRLRIDGSPGVGDGREIQWSTFGLVDRVQTGVTKSDTLELVYRNYLRDQGVRPGPNRLSVGVECFQKARIGETRVFGDSHLYLTSEDPHPVALRVGNIDDPVHVGDVVVVPVTIENSGSRPVRDVTLVALSDRRCLAVSADDIAGWPRLDHSVEASVTVKAMRPGDGRVYVAVDTSANDPSAEIQIRVGERPSDWSRLAYAAAATLAALGGFGAYRASRRGAKPGR